MSSKKLNGPVRQGERLRKLGSERTFQSLVESVADFGLCKLGIDGKILSWNKGAEHITLYGRDEIVNQDFSILFTPEEQRAGIPQRDLQSALIDGHLETQAWRSRRDGSVFWANSTLTACSNADGTSQGFAFVMQDLTVQRQSAEAHARLALDLEQRIRIRTGQLETLIDQLRAKNEQIEALATRVSHDLSEKEILLREVYHRVKNNLQVVQSLLKMRSRTLISTEARDAIDTAVQRVHVMSTVHEYLYQVPDIAGLTLSSFLRDVVEGAIASHSERGSRIKLQFDVDPLVVPLDFAIPLGLLANELVSNCLKHGLNHGGAGGIVVSARVLDGVLRFVVHDDGAGLPSDFNIANCSSMGIKLAASLTHQLGGKIEFTSIRGCRVQADLPRLWGEPKTPSLAIPSLSANPNLWAPKPPPSKSRGKTETHRFNSSTPFLA